MNSTKHSANIYPWHLKPWRQLCDAKSQGRLPHAILLLGACGIGKERFALAFAHAMLCAKANAEGVPCGDCHACHLLQANSHPDLLMVEAEQPGQVIKVDQIRDVVHFVNETSMQNGYRVIIINRAHNMNHNAANSLLKTLEEPTPNTLFLLLSGQGKRLQATITSRCQKLLLTKPERDIALSWLQTQLPSAQSVSLDSLTVALNLAENAPVKALTILSDDTLPQRRALYENLLALSQSKADPLAVAAQWQDRDLSLLFNLLFYWLQDLLQLIVIKQDVVLNNTDFSQALSVLSDAINRESVLDYLSYAQSRYANVISAVNLNRQLLLEDLFIRWTLISR